jgi:hypothetical protein
MPNTGFNQVSWYPGYVSRAGDIRFGIGNDTYVLGTFGSTLGNLYLNPTMTYTDGYRGFAERGNPILAPGSVAMGGIGSNFRYCEYLNENGTSLIENGYATYIMEGRISFASLGLEDVADASMTLAMSCNNDVGTVAAVPEPATLTLLGLGLLAYMAPRVAAKNNSRKILSCLDKRTGLKRPVFLYLNRMF